MNNQLLENQNVDLIEIGDKKIYLVGTAHISSKSADLAEEVIREVSPDSVAVELCDSRYQSLRDPTRWQNTDILAVLKSGRHYVLMTQLVLAGFQKKLGNQLETAPGAEMMRAITVADEIQSRVVLADRDVKTTLKRTWASLGLWSMLKITFAIFSGLFTAKSITEEEIENLKSADALEELMREFSEALPEVREALIDERDQYLAAKIQEAPGESVVAIIGAGHIPGIKSWLGKDIDTAPLDIIPPKKKLGRVIAWGIPATVFAMIAYGLFASGASKSIEMVEAWFWINACLGALGAAIALAHPLTILAAFIASPFTSLYPLIAGGWVAGLVEAIIRKPRVVDLANMGNDVASFKGIWGNRVLRILLVIAMTNLFGMLGTFIGMGKLAFLL